MAGCKNEWIMKYHSKLFVFNICHIEFIIRISKFTTVKHFGGDSLSRNINNNQHIKVSIKFWQNINEELLNIEYLIIFSQYFGNFIQELFVVWPHNCLCKISKILA